MICLQLLKRETIIAGGGGGDCGSVEPSLIQCVVCLLKCGGWGAELAGRRPVEAGLNYL